MKGPLEGRTTYRISLSAYGYFGTYDGDGFKKGAADPVDFPDLRGAVAVARIQAALVALDRRYFGHRRIGVTQVDHHSDRISFTHVFGYEIAEDSDEVVAGEFDKSLLSELEMPE